MTAKRWLMTLGGLLLLASCAAPHPYDGLNIALRPEVAALELPIGDNPVTASGPGWVEVYVETDAPGAVSSRWEDALHAKGWRPVREDTTNHKVFFSTDQGAPAELSITPDLDGYLISLSFRTTDPG